MWFPRTRWIFVRFIHTFSLAVITIVLTDWPQVKSIAEVVSTYRTFLDSVTYCIHYLCSHRKRRKTEFTTESKIKSIVVIFALIELAVPMFKQLKYDGEPDVVYIYVTKMLRALGCCCCSVLDNQVDVKMQSLSSIKWLFINKW